MKSGWLFFFMLISMASALGQIRTAGRNLWGRDEVKHAAIGVCVKNVETGQIVYEHNPQMALRPASVIKLLSSALALKREGDSLTYTTKFFYTGEIDEGRLFGNIVRQAGSISPPVCSSRRSISPNRQEPLKPRWAILPRSTPERKKRKPSPC